MMHLIVSTLEQSCIFIPLVLAIYFSYKIIGITDLTVDGSYVLGAGTFASLVSCNINPISSSLIAILAGMLAGIGVALIQKGNRINSLIAGILALFILQSVNFQVMGRPNINLQFSESLLTKLSIFGIYSEFVLVMLVSLICIVLMIWLLRTNLGLIFRAFGDNQDLLKILNKNPDHIKMLGLSFSNGLAALAGVIAANMSGFADLNMGLGVTLTGLGAVVIGCEIIKRVVKTDNYSIVSDIIGCLIGTIIYFSALNAFLMLGIEPINLKLVLGIILVIFLRIAAQRKTIKTEVSYAK